MPKQFDKARIKQLMITLDLTEEEAIELLQDDDDIDHGKAKDFDLSKEQEKIAKQYRNVGTRKVSDKPIKRERKPNEIKGNFIAVLAKYLQNTTDLACENVNITNKERQIAFSIGNDNFELTLVQKRPPKAKK